MFLAIKHVQALPNYQLMLTIENEEKRKFDMNPYLELGIFRELKDVDKFNTVRLSFDTIEWENEADLDPEVLYTDSVKMTVGNND